MSDLTEMKKAFRTTEINGGACTMTFRFKNNEAMCQADREWHGYRQANGETFQQRVAPWMQECFASDICKDIRERGDRLLEEVLELLQAHGYDPSRVATLTDYVFNRPVGDPKQEVGGVMVTLAAHCLATGIDMHEAGETELARIWTKVEQIRQKQQSKRDIHGPLP